MTRDEFKAKIESLLEEYLDAADSEEETYFTDRTEEELIEDFTTFVTESME